MSYPPPPADGAPDPYQSPPPPPPADPTLMYPPPPTGPAPTSGAGYPPPPGYGQPTSGAGYPPPPGTPGYGQPTSGGGYGPQPGYPPPPGYGPPGTDKNPFGGPAQYGQPAYGSPYGPPIMPTNTMAILSLVFAFIFPLIAVVLGHVAKGQISRTGEQGGGLATAGLILGYIGLVIMLAYCGVFIAAIAFSANSDFSTY
ncbi:MAG TPA: DUF4190 domain-containing protein [Actinoplanes sp.]|nr:DUF4190 domain-containing protein [Actinoplanes sp.]